MITPAQLSAYLANELGPDDRAYVETALTIDADGLRTRLGRAKVDAALQRLREAEPPQPPVLPATGPAIHPTKTPSVVTTPTVPLAPATQPPSSAATVTPEDVLKRTLLEAGPNAWAYRPSPNENPPGLVATLWGAFKEWASVNWWLLLLVVIIGGLTFFFATQIWPRPKPRSSPKPVHTPPPVPRQPATNAP